MTNEELLAEAKRRYPKGTRFRSPHYNKECIARGDQYLYSLNENSVFQSGAYFYYDGRWAEIIEPAEPVKVNQELFLI